MEVLALALALALALLGLLIYLSMRLFFRVSSNNQPKAFIKRRRKKKRRLHSVKVNLFSVFLLCSCLIFVFRVSNMFDDYLDE
jgi:di/tricarboxylate transporter